MLAIVTKPLAQAGFSINDYIFVCIYHDLVFLIQEIHYGDQACMTNNSAAVPAPQAVCQKISNETR